MTQTPPLRVLIADDHPYTRAGVRLALEQDAFVVCAEVDNAPDAVRQATATHPDVALLDIQMPGNGITAAERITALLPQVAVVMLTVSQADRDLFAALRAGARGYLLKDIEPSRLPQALRGVLAGEAALPRTLAARLMAEFRVLQAQPRRRVLGKRRVQLSDREWETLELLHQGLSTKQIAEQLYVTPATVRSHVSALLRKLHVSSRTEAVGLLGDEP